MPGIVLVPARTAATPPRGQRRRNRPGRFIYCASPLAALAGRAAALRNVSGLGGTGGAARRHPRRLRHRRPGHGVGLRRQHPGAPAQSAVHRQPRTTYYVSLGDSLSQGVQPNAAGTSLPTAQGYPNQLYAALRRTHPGLRLVKLGCGGETTTTMINGGICSYPAGSQLATAVGFLRSHRGRISLITIDIGANDSGLLPVPPVGQRRGLLRGEEHPRHGPQPAPRSCRGSARPPAPACASSG